jgi:prophage regulatory protein
VDLPNSPSILPLMPRPPRRILRIASVTARTTLPKSTIYALVSNGEFPAPKVLTPGGKAVGWSEDDVELWIASRPSAAPEGAKVWAPPPSPSAAPVQTVVAEKPRTLSKHGKPVGRPRRTDSREAAPSN